MAILDEARIHLEKALEIDPQFAEARLALAGWHLNCGKRSEAIRLLRESIAARPDLSEARLLLAEVLLLDNQEVKAIEQLQKAADIDPNDLPSRRRLALILTNKGETKKAADLFQRVVEMDPLDGEAHLLLGMLLEHPDDYKRAFLLFQIAADIMPEDYRPRYQMAELLLRGEYTDAEGNLVTSPDKPSALKHLHATLNLAPKHGVANLRVGEILLEKGDTRAAKRHFTKALEDHDSAGRACLSLVKLGFEAKKADTAFRFLNKAVSHPDARGDALVTRADYFIRNDECVKAEKDLQEAVTFFVEKERLLLEESDRAAANVNFARARRLNEDAFEARRAQGPAWGHLGRIKSNASKKKEAILYFEKALQANSAMDECRFELALLLENTKRDGEALEHFEAVLNVNWSHAETHFRLGERALAEKNHDKAKMHFLIVTDIVPSHRKAKARLKKLG